MKKTFKTIIIARFTGLLVCFMVSFFTVSAQRPDDQKDDQKDIVLYDPLFWKDQLKLSDAQSKKIQEINWEYYESLRMVLYDEHANREGLRTKAMQCLMQRSQKIWDTFQPKQKRKWRKIEDETMAELHARRTT
jgi:hypothetical protein